MRFTPLLIIVVLGFSQIGSAFAGQHNGPTTGCDKFNDTCSKKNDAYKGSHSNFKNS